MPEQTGGHWLTESLDHGFRYSIHSHRVLSQSDSAFQRVEVHQSDSFGRLLARLTITPKGKVKGSVDVGEWLVREGHAWSYRYRRDSGPYAEQQTAARTARKGLFATAHPEEPRDFRKRHGGCS